MRADLHIHTIYSDGANTPEEIARRARAAGVELISMTDHDSLGGLEEKRAAAEKCGLKFVSGWEVSSYEGDKVHVLGYRCTACEEYYAFLEKRKTGAVLRAQDIIEKANAYLGLNVSMEEVEREHLKKDAPLHTMHVVNAFAKRLSKKPMQCYEALFDKGKPAYSELWRPTPEEAIKVIHACGGLAVLAHPGRIRLENGVRIELINGLVERGLDGIECYHSSHTEKETEYLKAYAAAHGLLVTGGSDFHKDGGNRILGLPEFHASEDLLSALGIPL
ncbi:MAG: PHP domain-containing protein [Clostridia bacterium]|nr:PHP domain-containing protein [Clostridia bacterium]